MNRLKKITCIPVVWSICLASVVQAGESPAGRLPGNVLPQAYRLDLSILPDQPRFSGQVEIDVQFSEPLQQIWMHGRGLDVSSAQLVAGTSVHAATYAQVSDDGVVRVDFDAPIPAGPATLKLSWSAPLAAGLAGLYHVSVGDDDYAFTQFESIYARRAFPGFDEPAFKTPFDIRVTTGADYRAFSNTQVVATESLADGLQRLTFRRTEKLPTYLIAFAVGPFDLVEWAAVPATPQREKPLPLRGIATRGQGDRLAYALENTAAIVMALEDYFDSPYPYDKLDIVAVPDFAAGAMENAGLITYREPLILIDADPPVRQQRYYAAVHAHELAHQWFGNLVTMPWWDDIWLNEAFASWMQSKIAQQWNPSYHFDRDTQSRAIGAMGADSLRSARQIREPVTDAAGILNAFDAITYQKGAGVLQMLERYLGAETFRSGIRLHMRRFPHASATVYDLMDSLTEVAGKQARVSEVFESFLFQPGLPYLDATAECVDGESRLRLRQQRYLPLGSTADAQRQWSLPVCIAYGGADQRQEHCLLLDAAEDSFALPGACPDWVMPNAGGSGYLRWSQSSADFAALAEVFLTQLDAGERLSYVDALIAGVQNGRLAPSVLTAQLPMIASAPERSVVQAPVALIRRLLDEVMPAADAAALREAAVRAYVPRLAAVQAGQAAESPAEAALLVRSLTGLLALDLAEPTVRAQLLQASLDSLGYPDGPADSQALAPDLLQFGLTVAVEEADRELVAFLIEALSGSQDARFRQAATSALAHASDAASFALVRRFMFSPDARANEFQTWLGSLLNPVARDITWPWLQRELDDVLAQGSERSRRESPLWFGRWLCSAEDRDELARMFAGSAAQTAGAERQLDQGLESIELCTALRESLTARAMPAEVAQLRTETNPF